MSARCCRCVLACAALLAALVLGACGGSDDAKDSSKATPSTSDAKVDLVYIAHDFTPREAWDKERIAAYEKAHPNVNIKQTVIPYPAFDDKLKAAIVGGQVDIFANSTPLGPYFASGAVAPVDWKAMGFDSEDALKSKYTDKGLVPFSYEGKLYAVPNEATSYGFFINTKLFRAAGLDPDADYPKTWEEVKSLSEKLVKRDSKGRITQRGFDFAYPASNNWISPSDEYFPLIAQKGGRIVNDDGTASAFDSPGTVEVFKFIADWVHKDKLGGPPADDVTDEFIKGKVAMISIGPWFQPVLKKDAPEVYENLKVVQFPVFEGAEDFGPQLDGYGHMVNAKSSPDEQREAWKFIAFLDSLNEDPIPYVQRTGLLVPRKEVVDDADKLAATLKDHQVFLDALERPQLGLYDQLQAPKISEAISNAVDRVTAKNQSPQAAVSQASKEIDAALKTK